MSAKLMGMVWDLDLPHPEQSVLMALADHADHDGGHIYPGVDLIAWKTGYSIRQVQRILRTLEEMGIVTAQSGKGGRGKKTMYELHLEKGVKKSPFEPKGNGVKMSPIPIKGDNLSPNDDINGDILSPITEKRVTFSTEKGDIFDISTGSETRQDQAPLTPNHHRTTNTEYRGRVDIAVDVVGASPRGDVVALSSLCAQIAQASGVTLKADSLQRLIEQHPTLDAKRLIFEAEMAAEWIADPTRNKRKPKQQMTSRFLHGWYTRAEKPQEDAHATTSNGAYSTAANGSRPGPRAERTRKAAEPPDPSKHGIYAGFIRRD